MKRVYAFWTLVLILIPGLTGFARSPDALEPPAVLDIDWGDPEDKGELPPWQLVRRTATIHNRGRFPVQITVLAKSCTCLETECPPTLAPGEDGKIVVGTTVVEAAGVQSHGVRFRAARLESGVPTATQEFVLALSYTPRVDVLASLPLPNFVAVAGENRELPVYLRRPDGRAVRLAGTDGDRSWMTVTGLTTIPYAPGVSVLRVSIFSEKPGVRAGMLRVNAEAAAPREVAIVARFIEPAVCEPSGWVLDRDAANDDISITVRSRRDHAPLRGVRAVIEGDADQTMLRCTPAAHDGEFALRADLAAMRAKHSCGVAQVMFRDAQDRDVATFPVVWMPSQPPIPRVQRR